jgi:hypothetical protein
MAGVISCDSYQAAQLSRCRSRVLAEMKYVFVDCVEVDYIRDNYEGNIAIRGKG